MQFTNRMLTVFTDTGEAKNRLAKCDVNFKVPKAKWYVLFRIHTQWAPSNGSQRTHTHTHPTANPHQSPLRNGKRKYQQRTKMMIRTREKW